jgi:hypothetical protein
VNGEADADGVLGGGQHASGGQMHAGLGKDGMGMSRVRLNALDLPAIEEEPGSWSVRQPAEVVRRRVALSHWLSPGATRVTRGRDATVIRNG